MIPRFKNFSVFKAKPNQNEKLPTHAISMKLGDEFVNIGGCWTKDGNNGKYLSAKLADAWVSTDGGKSREGFCIVRESDLNKLEKMTNKDEPLMDFDGRDLTPNSDDIGF